MPSTSTIGSVSTMRTARPSLRLWGSRMSQVEWPVFGSSWLSVSDSSHSRTTSSRAPPPYRLCSQVSPVSLLFHSGSPPSIGKAAKPPIQESATVSWATVRFTSPPPKMVLPMGMGWSHSFLPVSTSKTATELQPPLPFSKATAVRWSSVMCGDAAQTGPPSGMRQARSPFIRYPSIALIEDFA